jgi:hypothetical protein
VTVYWSTANQTSCLSGGGDNVRSALEVAVLSGSVSDPTLSKFVYEDDDADCSRIQGAATPGAGDVVDGTTFNYAATFPISSGLIMRVIPVYNSTKIGITSSVALPTQGTIIESTGESGETVRKVQYFSSHPQIPLEIFPYSIISQ